MQFIQGNNLHQSYFTTPDDQVSADNAARLMDVFIDKLNLLPWLVYFPLLEALLFRGLVSTTITSAKFLLLFLFARQFILLQVGGDRPWGVSLYQQRKQRHRPWGVSLYQQRKQNYLFGNDHIF